MDIKEFLKELTIFSFFIAVILFVVQQIPRWNTFSPFSWICLSFFILFSIVIYLLGYRSLKKGGVNNALAELSVGFILGRMLFSGILIYLYNRFLEPTDTKFLIPFFYIYFSFLIFEIYATIKLGSLGSTAQAVASKRKINSSDEKL